MWVRKIFQDRHAKGELNLLIKDMTLFDHEYFFKQFRMLPNKLEELLSFVDPLIEKSSERREAVSPKERLCVTLRYLVTGDARVTIAASYRMSPTTIGRIINETCSKIWDVLLEKGFLKTPATPQEWEKIAHSFECQWNFPNCVGAIDGKHVVMQAPKRSGSSFFNYKGTHSLVLMAVCDADYKFTFVDIGESGRSSDGGVFASSNIGVAMENQTLNLPVDNLIYGSRLKFPYNFVGDEAFPLKRYLMRPFPKEVLDETRRIFNYRLSRARRVIENTGICASRFRVFRKPIIADVENVVAITKTVVALHNYLVAEKNYSPPGFVDVDNEVERRRGEWREYIKNDKGMVAIGRVGSNNFTDAKVTRNSWTDYFSSEAGAVSWQHDVVLVHRIHLILHTDSKHCCK